MKTILEKLMVLPIMMICLTSLQSCGKDIIVDKTGVLEVSPNSVSFGSSGGTAVIECASNGFYISYIRDIKTGNDIYIAPMNPDDDKEEIPLDGIHVTHKKWAQQVEITVSPSDMKHEWNVQLVKGSFVADITVTQGD